MLVGAVTFPHVILAIHVLGAVVGFGAVFAYPLLFSAAAAMDPSVTPWLLRTRRRVGRLLVNPGLAVVLLAGIYLASDEHQWKFFYVQWGLGAAIVIGAIEGAIVIPRCGRLADLAERDLAGAAVAAGGRRTSATWSRDYASGYRAVRLGSALIELIVAITVVLMATH